MEGKQIPHGGGRPRKYATAEEARLANAERARKRAQDKKDEVREYKKNYHQRTKKNKTTLIVTPDFVLEIVT